MSEISSLVTAGAAVAGMLGAAISFVWVRLESINKARKNEIQRCNQERRQDRVMSRERRAILLTVIELLLNVVRRHDPHAPEIGETREMLTDFRKRERVEAEQEEAPEPAI